MINELIILVAAALAQASPTPTSPDTNAQAKEGAANHSESETSDDGDRIICRRYAQTGTRVRTKVCHTASQWKQIRDRAQRVGQRIQDKGAIDPSRRPDG